MSTSSFGSKTICTTIVNRSHSHVRDDNANVCGNEPSYLTIKGLNPITNFAYLFWVYMILISKNFSCALLTHLKSCHNCMGFFFLTPQQKEKLLGIVTLRHTYLMLMGKNWKLEMKCPLHTLKDTGETTLDLNG